jgi:hypothetical protein
MLLKLPLLESISEMDGPQILNQTLKIKLL